MDQLIWFTELVGRVVDRYTLDHFLGSGNIGYVYKAFETDLPDRVVAVKLTAGKPRDGWDNELRKVSLLSTISGVVHLHHHGVGQITHRGSTEVFVYSVWDYIHPGRNLHGFLDEGRGCTASFLLALVEQVLRVLHACHIRGVKRHGDLHPGNILIGDPDPADIDERLELRNQIWIADFGRGATGGRAPKDDYHGLAEIVDAIVARLDWEISNSSDRGLVMALRDLLRKVLREGAESERKLPREILEVLQTLKFQARAAASKSPRDRQNGFIDVNLDAVPDTLQMRVGEFQISEMLGENWTLWQGLFVPKVPARSRILEPDITTVVTGPRGCGKTMLFRRLSQRLVVECGSPDGDSSFPHFAGFYINANDIADAFSSFPDEFSGDDRQRLTCFANLCFLSDFLSVLSARESKRDEAFPQALVQVVAKLLGKTREENLLVRGESLLERTRSELEEAKWRFPLDLDLSLYEGFRELGHHGWLNRFVPLAVKECSWLSGRRVILFVDDYTMPRVTAPMQRVLNRLFFQRSSNFVVKIATESASTFVAEDSSGKVLQDGDDYQLVDMGEESLFLSDAERRSFLEEIFRRRLTSDPRISPQLSSLNSLLGELNCSKTEFARLLRGRKEKGARVDRPPVTSQARGATRRKVLYHGADCLASLWSGDTRLMIQLVQDLVDQATADGVGVLTDSIDDGLQDQVFRNRGSLWLEAQARSLPTNPSGVEAGLKEVRLLDQEFRFEGGSFGTHLKAIVEAFQKAARHLLLGPTYTIEEKGKPREVPRMAFRIEVVDAFRLDGLAAEIYRDLIRYGLFMRDARGRSVRGFMVPRLYLRRLLLPYCLLALSKRDSVPLSCEWFETLLLRPDMFAKTWVKQREDQLSRRSGDASHQMRFGFEETGIDIEPEYDDLEMSQNQGDQ